MKKIFISYHFGRQQEDKDKLVKEINKMGKHFEIRNSSVEIGDISDDLTDREIFKIIREKYLKDSNITIVLLGKDTGSRKFIDWEIAASLSVYGSISGRIKTNSLIILLTDDFIKGLKSEENLVGYKSNEKSEVCNHSLITLENSSPRIFSNVQNGYAVVGYLNNVLNDFNHLNLLIKQAKNKSKNTHHINSFNLKSINQKTSIEEENDIEEEMLYCSENLFQELNKFNDIESNEQEKNENLDHKHRRNTISFE